jgi:competence protein ComEC
MSLSLLLFDVGRGLCVAIRTPNNHLVVIDCGCSDDVSPIRILSQCSSFWTGREGHALTQLIITHPHTDHIADIAQVTALMPPSIIVRRQDIDWKRLIGGKPPSAAFTHYAQHYLAPNYSEPVPPVTAPIWGDGMTLWFYSLREATAARVSKTDNAYINNTSLVTIVKYRGYTIVVHGDIEAEGLDELLLQEPGLRTLVARNQGLFGQQVSGVDFLIAPHHGHASGFSSIWFLFTGPTRICNIVSERRVSPGEDPKQAEIDNRYSDAKYSLGANAQDRKMVSTKGGQFIGVFIHDDGKWSWNITA